MPGILTNVLFSSTVCDVTVYKKTYA